MAAAAVCHVALTEVRPLPSAYPSELITLGDHLCKRRLDLGLLQQRKVPRVLGTTESTIVNWELTHTAPQLRFLPAIIAFLDYDPHDTASGTARERLAVAASKRLSQRQLARQLGIDPSTMGRWEVKPSWKSGTRLQSLLYTAVESGEGPGLDQLQGMEYRSANALAATRCPEYQCPH